MCSHIQDKRDVPHQFLSATVIVAEFLNSADPALLGRYLRKCLFHKHFASSSPSFDMASIFRPVEQNFALAEFR